jgi:hypothetical protein
VYDRKALDGRQYRSVAESVRSVRSLRGTVKQRFWRPGYASTIPSLTSFTPLAFARLLDDVHALATLGRRLTAEIDSTLAMARDLATAVDEAIPKLDALNAHFEALVPEAGKLNERLDGAVPAARTLNSNLEGAVPQAEALNKHLEAAIPLLVALEPVIREGLDLIGPLEGSIDRLGKMLDRAAISERIGPLMDRLSGKRPRESE